MKIMPASWDDLVVPKFCAAGWQRIRVRDWRVPLVMSILAGNFLFAYYVLTSGLTLMESYGADYPLRAPWAYGAFLGDGLALLSLTLMALAGVSSAAWARHACRPSFDAKKIASRLLLVIHIVLLSSALISIVGIYLYFEWWQIPIYKSWFPTCFVAVACTAAGLIARGMRPNHARRPDALASYLPLIHQACVLWLFIVFYYSTLGNIVGVIK
jgi:hypothetical protein